jgi:hypothetical protein
VDFAPQTFGKASSEPVVRPIPSTTPLSLEISMRGRLACVALLIVILIAPGQIVGDEKPVASSSDASAETYAGHGERYWRNAFQQVRGGLDSLEPCRATLPDYCSWEYWESRNESDARAYRAYLEAKRRGEPAEDPLARKIYIPEACQKLFDTYPEGVTVEADPDAPHSCPGRISALVEAIDKVEAYWRERGEELEREAHYATVPRHWRE